MRREIKFRYWNGVIAKMVNDPMIRAEYEFSLDEYINTDRGWIWMQYTGLKDQNGVEIYEGDIVKHEKTIFAPNDYYSGEPAFQERTFIRTGHITIRPSCGVFINGKTEIYDYSDGDLIETLKQTGLAREFHEYAEVIGNIYENPELIE